MVTPISVDSNSVRVWRLHLEASSHTEVVDVAVLILYNTNYFLQNIHNNTSERVMGCFSQFKVQFVYVWYTIMMALQWRHMGVMASKISGKWSVYGTDYSKRTPKLRNTGPLRGKSPGGWGLPPDLGRGVPTEPKNWTHRDTKKLWRNQAHRDTNFKTCSLRSFHK